MAHDRCVRGRPPAQGHRPRGYSTPVPSEAGILGTWVNEHHLSRRAPVSLRTLQDTDKHEKLTFLGPVLKKAQVTVEGLGAFGIIPGLHNGAAVYTSPKKVNVKVEGEIGIPFGVRHDQGYEFPLTFDMILNFVAREVLPALEPFVG